MKSFYGPLIFPLLCILLFAARPALAQKQPAPEPDVVLDYKRTANKDPLKLHVFRPAGWKKTDKRSVIVFFFGGGWVGGTPKQFFPQARHLADRGMVAISAQYRTQKSHGVKPFACIEDGKSAIRWVRANAEILGIDPGRVVAGGGSAGGHVAASTGTIQGMDAPSEDANISSRPNAMVLFNPVIDTSKDGFGFKKLGPRWKDASPSHHVAQDTPPTIIFQGTADTTTPIANAEGFEKKMKALQKRCDLVKYDGEKHGFFNHGRKSYEDTVKKMDAFLVSLGYLQKGK